MNTTTNERKRKRPTKKEQDHMEDLANDSAARVVDTPSGSLMYLEQKKQEQEELPSEKARTFLREFFAQAVDFHGKVEGKKKAIIERAARILEKILKAENLDHLIPYISTHISKTLKPLKGFVTDRYVRECLPEKYKDPEQHSRALAGAKSGGTSSADTREKSFEEKVSAEKDKWERAHDEKGVMDYTPEQIDKVTNIEIAKDGWKFQLGRAEYYKALVEEKDASPNSNATNRNKSLISSNGVGDSDV